MDVCTIIAKNYLAQARVLARSFTRNHPGARMSVLVIDDVDGYIDPEQEPFELLRIDQLGIERFQDMAMMYDVLELSTAVKPWLLKWLLARSPDGAVVYLDPDMRLYAPLDEMFEAVRRHGLVLSPHNLEPMPRDGRKPSEQDILIAGVYNLGFVGINAGAFADELLEWWSIRLARDCIVDPQQGLFVDQRWMDFAPGMAESFHLLRDAGFNVAYWNLHSRPVSERDGNWWVKGDVPLRLFHFSGYDYRVPGALSRHQDRIELSRLPELRRLCDDYGRALVEEGVDEVSRWPYTYAMSASGMPLDGLLRRLYRDLALRGFDGSPFEPEGEAAFLAELNAPAATGGEHGITRYLEALHARRPDLQRAYPELGDADAPGYLGWVHVWGREQIPVPDVLMPPLPEGQTEAAALAPADAPDGPPPALGVNVAGYLTSEMGVGEVARQLIGALDAVGVPSLPVGIAAPRGRQGHTFVGLDAADVGHPVNLVCVNADMLPRFASDVGPEFFAGRRTIGMWWWEVSTFPSSLHGAFDHVDEVWAGSRFVADALAKVSPVPVVHIPMPVTLSGTPLPARERLGIPDGFAFLFVYDYNSVFERKNPLGLLDAFLQAFPDPGEGASLVLKSINADHHPDDHARVVAAAEGHPNVRVIDHFLSPEDRNRLIASCDAYASLHRSEGFGITMAEAMLLGKPVVATGYSGNLDFMTPENSWLVRHEERRIGPGAEPYPADAVWAEPDLEHAAACLREVFADREEARRRGAQASVDIHRDHSPYSAGEAIVRRLATIPLETLRGAAPARIARRHLEEADGLLRVGARPPADRRAMPGRSLARRTLLRAIKPHTAFQFRVDRELVSGARELGERIDAIAERQLKTDSEMLREMRRLAGRVGRLDAALSGDGAHTLGEHVIAMGRRIDDLAGQVDALRSVLATFDQHAATLLERGGAAVAPGDYPVAPAEPWTHEYNEAHGAFVARELDDAVLLAAFRSAAALPGGFGVGFDERVVEFPWIAAQRLGGRVLDAGSTLNHGHVLKRLRSRMDQLDIVTLAPEARSFPELHVSYLYADLRELPLVDARYDRVLSISTLEHVGMEVAHFGADAAEAVDPQPELLRAVAELRRVLKPGGDLYVTVPVGRGERFPWVRSLTLEELDELVDASRAAEYELTYFRHLGPAGWQRVTREDVTDARYRDHLNSPPPGEERLVAAEAVACLRATLPGTG